jgi:glycosyltransferase involved in cell wall biosynthesis
MAKQLLVLAGGGTQHVSGGVGTMMLYLMDEWARRGETRRVQVLDTRGAGGALSGAYRFLAALLGMTVLRAAGRVDLVHAHMTTRGSVLRKGILCSLAWLIGLPVVVHMHGADFFEFYEARPVAQRRLIGWALRRARHVVVLGESWRRFLIDRVGLDAGRVSVVLNGVAAPPKRPARRHEGPTRILFLGRIGDRKGVPELLQALALPALQALDWQATIAGDGEVGRLTGMALALDLGDRVSLPGWVGRDAAQALLAEADILVLPSHHEALPIAVIEALAHGVAVVATPVGAVPEILTHERDALLVQPGDVAALAQAMGRLIEEPALRERLAAEGYRVFLDRLDIRSTAPRMMQILQAALEPAERKLPVEAICEPG